MLDQAVDDLHCARDRITVRYVGPLVFDARGQSGDPTQPSSTFLVNARGCSASADYACTEMQGGTRCCNIASRSCY